MYRVSTIDNLFLSFVNICPPRILPMPKGIEYLSSLHAKKLHKPKLPHVDEDRRSTTIVFRVVPLLT
jgi:hypothetical protein